MEEDSRAAAFSGIANKRPASESATGQAKPKKMRNKRKGSAAKKTATREEGNPGSSGLSDVDEGTNTEAVVPEAVSSGRRIYLQNLDYNATEEDVLAVLTSKNFTSDLIDIPVSTSDGKTKGYALVDFTSPAEAQRAIVELTGCLILTREVSVGLSTSTKAPPKQKKKKKKKGKPMQPASPEEGEIDEGEQVEKSTASNVDSRSKEFPSIMGELGEHLQRVLTRHPDFSEIEQHTRGGRVLVVTADWPSKKKQKNKKKVNRKDFGRSFYNSIQGQCLAGLYAAQEPVDPNPKEPLRLLLIYETSASATSARQLLNKVKFTMQPDYEIMLHVSGLPALDLRSVVHLAGTHADPKTVGNTVQWIPINSSASKVLQSAFAESMLLQAQNGQLATESFVAHHRVEPDQEVAHRITGNMNSVPTPPVTLRPEHSLQPAQIAIHDINTNPQDVIKGQLDYTSSRHATTTIEQPSQTIQNQPLQPIVNVNMDGSGSYPYEIGLPPKPIDLTTPPSIPPTYTQHIRSTLADLTPEERNLQFRYWGHSRDIDLARCPTCSREGHMSESCPSRTCRNCNAVDLHFASACPHAQKCDRCGEKGHSIHACPSKLKLVGEELECDLCSGKGHHAYECTQLWSTYFPDRLQTVNKVSSLVVGCYSCGSQLHWGADCDLGSRDVKLFSDAFSAKEANRYLLNPKQASTKTGMKIKGRASREVIVIDSDDDEEYEPSAFVHKKMDRPPAHGSISMNLGAARTGRNNNGLPTHTRSNGNPNLPARPDREPLYHDYPAYPPPQSYNSRHRSRSPERRPRDDYSAYHGRDRTEAPQQRRAFPPRSQSNRHSGQPQMGRYQPRR